MASKFYIMTIRTPDKDIPTILQVLKGAATLVSLEEEGGTPAEVTPNRRTARRLEYVDGKRNKGITGEALALEVIDSTAGIVTADHLASAFEARGFSGKSASPVMSRLVEQGKVVKLRQGQWAKKGTTIHMSAASKEVR